MSETQSEGLKLSPFCIDLRSKKALFLGRPPMEESDLLDASRHTWCRRTMNSLGPDGEWVAPSECRAGRDCFKTIL